MKIYLWSPLTYPDLTYVIQFIDISGLYRILESSEN